MSSPSVDPPASPSDAPHRSATEALLYRWFVEYNPFYLLSAMLVLVGVTALSMSAAGGEGGFGRFALGPLISEAYALALIGGAALLTRIGQRRPAVMLGLLAVLYQGDLTLLTERANDLASGGGFAVAAWLALFAVKLFALGRALKLRLSRGFTGVALAGGATLALLPTSMARATESTRGLLLTLVTFALVAAVSWTKREVTSTEDLTPWQATVLRRSMRATWWTWGAAFAFHLWVENDCFRPTGLLLLLPAATLLMTQALEGELWAWTAVAASVATPRLFCTPAQNAALAVMATALLLRRAFTAVRPVLRVGESPMGPIYRHGHSEIGRAPVTEIVAVRDERARARYLGGALFTTWLAVGEITGRPRSLVLAAALVLAMVALVTLTRQMWSAAAPSLAVASHMAPYVVLIGALAPSTLGALGVALGFVMLGGSIAVSYRLRDRGAGTEKEPIAAPSLAPE